MLSLIAPRCPPRHPHVSFRRVYIAAAAQLLPASDAHPLLLTVIRAVAAMAAARVEVIHADQADRRASDVVEVILALGNGVEATILSYGGILRTLVVPDRAGNLADVVLGFDSLAEYESGNPFFGAIVGRAAGRISEVSDTMHRGRTDP